MLFRSFGCQSILPNPRSWLAVRGIWPKKRGSRVLMASHCAWVAGAPQPSPDAAGIDYAVAVDGGGHREVAAHDFTVEEVEELVFNDGAAEASAEPDAGSPAG